MDWWKEHNVLYKKVQPLKHDMSHMLQICMIYGSTYWKRCQRCLHSAENRIFRFVGRRCSGHTNYINNQKELNGEIWTVWKSTSCSTKRVFKSGDMIWSHMLQICVIYESTYWNWCQRCMHSTANRIFRFAGRRCSAHMNYINNQKELDGETWTIWKSTMCYTRKVFGPGSMIWVIGHVPQDTIHVIRLETAKLEFWAELNVSIS